MSDVLGRITIPSFTASAIFPLRTEFPHGRAQKRLVVVHQFGSANAKIEQRFYVGSPATRYTFHRARLNNSDRSALQTFWDARKGSEGPFLYDVPEENGTFTRKTVYFENTPLTLDDLSDWACSVGLTFVEIPDPTAAPVYTLASTLPRFPDATLASALLDQVQTIVPLVRIRVLDVAVPDILISDRRVTVGGLLYLPRLLDVPTVSQNIDGSSDDVTFRFGNADRVMVQVANDTQLRWARIELSLFHVGTGIKLDLWAGYLVEWQSDAGPEFSVRASDILSALTLSSPVGIVSRRCWRRYQLDGCPATGTVDTTHFPAADGTKCDLGYNTANGCMAHDPGGNTTRSYGATYCAPQGVLLRSGGLGVVAPFTGIGHGVFFLGMMGVINTWYPRTSLIADTIFGQTLPEIWHHDDGIPQYGLPVMCKMAAGRDEDQFYAALGIVGAGPLGAFTSPQMVDISVPPDGIKETFVGSNLDGAPNHGFQVDSNGNLKAGANATFGIRQVLGTDPAGAHDYFSLGRVSATGAGWFTQASDGSPMDEVAYASSAYNLVFAPGVAFCEMRRVKPNNDPLTSPAQHTMIASVSQGLTGLAWTAPGSRTTIAGCTNPFWVAVNTYLRAIGILGETGATQELAFDSAAAIAAAAIADLTVTKIIGTGTETQFRFKGVIDGRKPARDWLQAILNSGLGYYTWSFGKLKLGCRINASAAVAFTSGNMLFNSLRLTPVTPKFEKLTVSFNDQEYTFQSNTVDYTDQDHAARNRRAQNPLGAEFPLSGCSTKSQSGRIGAVRAREELGGVTAAEQDAARGATWKSTILSLDTEAGMVGSVTDADLPGGVAKFRVQSWRLNRDYSIDLQGQSVVDSMYDLTSGPKPVDVQPAPVPTEAPVLWLPNYETPVAGDPLFTANGFGIAQVYDGAGDGSALAGVSVYGDNPPHPAISLFFKIRRELVSGVFAQVAASVTTVDATHGTIALGAVGSLGSVTAVGRIISKLANALGNSSTVPIQDFTVTSYDALGNFTVTPDPAAAGCAAGDLFTLRTAPTAADATSFTDDLFANLYNAGLTTTGNGNKGNIALVIGGKGAFQSPQTVTINTGTKVTISPGWDVGQTPDATSVIVLVDALQVSQSPDASAGNGASLIGTLQIPNYQRKVVRVEGYLSSGITRPIQTVPFRELYLWGAQGTRLVAANATQLPGDGLVRFDTSGITPPAPTTLAAAITTTTGPTVLTVASGINIVNGTYFSIGTEKLYATAGGGTTSITADRGQLGTTAATHLNGATVTLGGALAFSLLPGTDVPNQALILRKTSADLNFVTVLAFSGDTFVGGTTTFYLPDNSADRGTKSLKAPGA